MEEVWVVTVFESGDCTTSVWAVYDDEEMAENYKKELLDGYYLEVSVTKHEVLKKGKE